MLDFLLVENNITIVYNMNGLNNKNERTNREFFFLAIKYIMRKYKINKLSLLCIIIILLINILVFLWLPRLNGDLTLNYYFSASNPGKLQLFYTNNDNPMQWSEEQSIIIDYTNINNTENIIFKIPFNTSYIRLDFFYQDNQTKIINPTLSYWGKDIPLEKNLLLDTKQHFQISDIDYSNNSYTFTTTDHDPYIVYSFSNNIVSKINEQNRSINNLIKIFLCIIFDIIIFLSHKKLSLIYNFIRDLYKNKALIFSLSRNDFKTKYVGSYLGIFWALIQPIVTILTYWFVFEFGLKASSPIQDVPFVLWFISGLIPWFFFQEALINATNCLIEYSYLVKKVVFNINILPIVKIISSYFVHLIFLFLLILAYIANGSFSGIYALQIMYYSFSCFVLVLSISYATASIVIFLKDLGQFITITLQLLMWMTPIMWSETLLPTKLKWVSFINPIFYIVDGFRNSLISNIWFWNKPYQTLYFWFITMVLFMFGSTIFRRLKPHFADVL